MDDLVSVSLLCVSCLHVGCSSVVTLTTPLIEANVSVAYTHLDAQLCDTQLCVE